MTSKSMNSDPFKRDDYAFTISGLSVHINFCRNLVVDCSDHTTIGEFDALGVCK